MNSLPRKVNLSDVSLLLGAVDWQDHSSQGRQGALINYLYSSQQSGQSVALVRFQPRSSAPTHEHLGHESIFVIEGDYEDEYGRHVSGDLVVYQPGSRHSWRSEIGATLYVVWGGTTQLATDTTKETASTEA